MIVTTTAVRPFGLLSTIISFEGIDTRTGDVIVFGVDHRPARDIREALEQGDQPEVEIEGWAILSRTHSPERAAQIEVRKDEAAFRAAAVDPAKTLLGSFEVISVGRFSPGDDSAYAAAVVVCRDNAKLTFNRLNGRSTENVFSTNQLIHNDERDAWYLQSGHYDLTLEAAIADAKDR